MRTRRWVAVGVLGGLGLLVGVSVVVGNRPTGRSVRPPARVVDARSPLGLVAERLGQGDSQALIALHQRVSTKAGVVAPAFRDEAEAAEWLQVLRGLGSGFSKFGAIGRASALAISGRIFDRYGVDPVPSTWTGALAPIHDLMTAGLADAEAEVRAAAMTEIGKFWVWSPETPDRDLTSAEQDALGAWKEGFHDPVVRRLADRERRSRAAAVACLGALPIDEAAAPAVALAADPDPLVRQQVLFAFIRRRDLLTEDAILPMLHDPNPAVALEAQLVLRGRGLTQDQVELGRLIFQRSPERRASAIPQLLARTDIDPVVWLLHLSHDADESVRARAVSALADRTSPEVRQRLEEMALSDPSATVRQAALKLVPSASESTVALPPLPGSPSLTPKAN